MRRSIVGLALSGACLLAVATAHAADWLPISSEELQMRSEPKAPAAPAIYLYRQVDRDDNVPVEFEYARIKVLTEEGRKYADVEIPFVQGNQIIRGIEARTIRPDGSVVEFTGTIYDKPIMKARGIKVFTKAFTLANVEVGSIVEYRYTRRLDGGYVFNSNWSISEDLFTRQAKFSLKPYNQLMLRWSWPSGLPPGTNAPKEERGVIRLETHDVPAFVTEDYMPPEDTLKYRVDFIYTNEPTPPKDDADYWRKYAKRFNADLRKLTDKRSAMEKALAQIIQPGDSAETKLRKIYARTQQIRNTSFERQLTEQETQREKQPEARNVEDVWTRGYGDAVQITWLFLALTRTAGIEAVPLLAGRRDEYFFNPKLMNPRQLNAALVVATVDGKDVYLDPGTPFTPFGLAPWYSTGVLALRLDAEGGKWISVPMPAPTDSRTERKMTLQLTPEGSLQGKVTVTYTGLEALWQRLLERNDDEAARTQFLEEQIQEDIPTGIEVKVINTPAWNSSESAFVVEYQLTVPGWASSAGRRWLLPAALFGQQDAHTFERAARVHPLYFHYPYQHEDDVTLELPPGWKVDSVPKARSVAPGNVSYSIETQPTATTLHTRRALSLNLTVVDVKYYEALRNFFNNIRAGDEEQIVLSPIPMPTKH